MDTLSKSERSARMRLVKSRDTKPELLMRRLVDLLGYRYGIHEKTLPGHPDLVFSKHYKVIFVHGCFWHRHNRCQLARLPKSNPEFWLPKLEKNKRRDRAIRSALTRQGWRSLVIWECELHDPVRVMIKTLVFLED
jgi:DNA mismatch endonuclease, patch repair protein